MIAFYYKKNEKTKISDEDFNVDEGVNVASLELYKSEKIMSILQSKNHNTANSTTQNYELHNIVPSFLT
jgi:hypothetical protein